MLQLQNIERIPHGLAEEIGAEVAVIHTWDSTAVTAFFAATFVIGLCVGALLAHFLW